MAHLIFDGENDYVEIADSPDFSVGPEGLAVSAWMRPDALTFPWEEGQGGRGYVHWLGKGEGNHQEWTFRMYGQDNSEGRGNRISFYVFNPSGGQGVGSYFQDPIQTGEWIHVVGSADSTRTHIYRDGVLRDSDRYADTISPEHGTAPLRIGTRDFRSFFQGAIGEMRIWRRALTAEEVADLHATGKVPEESLVAEFLDNVVTAGPSNPRYGAIFGATCSDPNPRVVARHMP
ncbi:MAG: LamG domain-containing protein [Actinomycetota bacterium]